MRRVLDFFSSGLRKIEIRYRLTISFILLSLLPLIVSGYISYLESSKAIQDKARLFSTEIVKQVSKNIQLQMGRIETASEELVLSDRVQNALVKYDGDDEAAKIIARSDLTKALIEKYGSFTYINQKYFLDRENRIFDSQVFSQLGKGVVDVVTKAPVMHGRPYWCTYSISAGQKSVVMLRAMHIKANNYLAGTLFVGIKPSYFSTIFDNVDLGSNANTFVVNGATGELITSSNKAINMVIEPLLLEQVAASLKNGIDTNFTSYADQGSSTYLAAFSRIPNTGWYVISTIPLHNLIAEAESVRNKMILIGLLCFIFAIMLSLVISRSIAMPLKKLIAIMKETETGNYQIRMTYEGKDEITALSAKFNEMASKVHENNERLEERVNERTRDLELANSKLAAISATDGLTGIANRRRFDEVLASEWLRAMRNKHPIALLMLDVDWFKKYNDHYGHLAGDECLRKVSNILKSNSRRASDLVARYGGEEFVLIAAETDFSSAMILANTICQAIASSALPHASSHYGYVTVSIGVAVLIPEEGRLPEALVDRADHALYSAKALGRNRVVSAESNTAGAV